MTITNISDREIALQARVAELEAIEKQLSDNVVWQAGEIAKHLATIEASRKQEPVVYLYEDEIQGGAAFSYARFDEHGRAKLKETFLYAAPVVAPDVLEKYDELIYAVHSKFPNETRHETALRYIKRMEEPATTSTAKATGGAND